MSQQPFAPRRPLLALTALGAAMLLAACSSKPPAPREQMAVAKTTVERASGSPGAVAAAPVELQAARDKLTRAQRAMDDKDYTEARRLAEQAQADARLAEARSAAARSSQALKEVQDSLNALQSELNRRPAN
ncbi:MAG: DUF4398 domain-containing protein [Pseudomonadota bacterium]|nr:DUF4398 domain-containing protein [Pseudomonadota bacterium]